MQLSSDRPEAPKKPKQGRLVANLRPVGPEGAKGTAERRGGTTSSRANTRARGQSRTRPARNPKPASVTRQIPDNANRFTVGGLNISLRALVALLLVSVVALVVIPILLQWADQQRSYRAAVAETEAATVRAERLEAELENWDDPQFVAGQARSRLGYVDPGETQYTVLDAEVSDPALAEEPVPDEWPPKPWTLALEEQILEVDHPPAVKAATQVRTVPTPSSTEEE